MRLPVKKVFFDAIVKGFKNFEYRDAHLSFVCEETGEVKTVKVLGCRVIPKRLLPSALR